MDSYLDWIYNGGSALHQSCFIILVRCHQGRRGVPALLVAQLMLRHSVIARLCSPHLQQRQGATALHVSCSSEDLHALQLSLALAGAGAPAASEPR